MQFNMFLISFQNAIEELAQGNVQVLNIPPAPIIIPEIENKIGKYFSYVLVKSIINIKINIYVIYNLCSQKKYIQTKKNIYKYLFYILSLDTDEVSIMDNYEESPVELVENEMLYYENIADIAQSSISPITAETSTSQIITKSSISQTVLRQYN